MKNNRWFLLLALLLLFHWGQEVWAQPETILLKSAPFSKRQRSPVSFPHTRHLEGGLSCTVCHHRYEQGKNVLNEADLEPGREGIRCQECHGAKAGLDLQRAFHRQCLDCHRTAKKEGKKSVPLFCGECHVTQ